MANPILKLLPASFRGVPFRVRNEYKDRDGRRHIVHEFPDSKRREVQDLGEILPEFTINAFVHSNMLPDKTSWLARAAALREALRQKGHGKLVLPTFGSFLAYALPDFRETASQTKVGQIEFTIRFAVATEITAPRQAGKIIEDVYDSGDASREAFKVDLDYRWIVVPDAASVEVAQYDFNAFLKNIRGEVFGLVGRVNEFTKRLTTASAAFASIVRDGNYLSDTLFGLDGLFNGLSIFLNGTVAAFNSVLGFKNFGSSLPIVFSKIRAPLDGISDPDSYEIPLWPENTILRKNRNTNRKNFVQSVRMGGLVVAYEQAAVVNYTTKRQVQETRAQLESAYFALFQENITENTSIYNQPEIRSVINNVRSVALEILQNKEQQAFGLTDFNITRGTSAFNLAYSLYGDEFRTSAQVEERLDLLKQLNPLQPAINFSGDIEIFKTEQAVV